MCPLEYPENTIWYIEASPSDDSYRTQGSAVAIRLQKKDEPQSATTYLITCAHVVRGKATDGSSGFGAFLPQIHVCKSGAGHNTKELKEVEISSIKSVRLGEVPSNERTNAADDWVILEFKDKSVGSNADAVRQWAAPDSRGNDYTIIGFPGGEISFPESRVIPTKSHEQFKFRHESNGVLVLNGDATRAGISGGGVFESDNDVFAGIHRARIDPALQTHAVSAKKIRDKLHELGYEVISYPLSNSSQRQTQEPSEASSKPLEHDHRVYGVERLDTDYFVQRSGYLKNLKKHLLSERTRRITAIHGSPGTGKSMLALALANDTNIKNQFKDGVFWIPLGKQRDDSYLLETLIGWLRKLGHKNIEHITTLKRAVNELKELLQDKVVLFVLDNAYNLEDVQLFLGGEPLFHILITTRNKELAIDVGAFPYPSLNRGIRGMTLSQSLQLLSNRLGRALDESEREKAEQLADKLNRLPSALVFVAKRIIMGKKFEDFHSAQETEDLLDISWNELSDENKEYFTRLGILREGAVVSLSILSTIWEKPEKEAEDNLDKIWTQSLLWKNESKNQINEENCTTYQIPTIIHDYAKQKLQTPEPNVLSIEKAHKNLLESYRGKIEGRPWNELPYDGYIHANLTWHMEQAGNLEEIHELLQEKTQNGLNAWYQVCDKRGLTTEFLMDVERAWRLAEKNFEDRRSESLNLEFRYALMKASVNSLARKISADLILYMVKTGEWTATIGLAKAKLLINTEEQVKAFIGLAPELSEEKHKELLQFIQQKFDQKLQQEYNAKVEVLSGISPHLSEENILKVISITKVLYEVDKYKVLNLIALKFKNIPTIAEKVRQAVDSIKDESRKNIILTNLEKQNQDKDTQLPQEHEIQDESAQAKFLIGLAPYLSEDKHEKLLEETKQITDESAKVEALSGLASSLSEKQLWQALNITKTLRDDKAIAEALGKMAPHLLEEQLSEALNITKKLRDDEAIAKALGKMAPYLLEEQLSEALNITKKLRDDSAIAEALGKMAPHLLEEQLSEALNIIKELLRDDVAIVIVLGKLAPYLLERQLREALELVHNISDKFYVTEALRNLAPRFSEQQLLEAKQIAETTQDNEANFEVRLNLVPYDRSNIPELLETVCNDPELIAVAKGITKLASYLSEGEFFTLWRAVESSSGLKKLHGHKKYIAIENLAPQLPKVLLPQIVESAKNIQNEKARADALSVLIPYLSTTWCSEVLAAVLDNQQDHIKAKAIKNLASQLPRVLLPEIVDSAKEIEDEQARADALSDLTPYLSTTLKSKVLAAVLNIENEQTKANALIILAQHIPNNMLLKVWESVKVIKDNEIKVRAICSLLPNLPQILQFEALQVILNIPDLRARSKGVEKIAAMSHPSYFVINEHSNLHKVLRSLAELERSQLLQLIPKLSLSINTLGDNKTLVNLVDTVLDVARQWP